MVRSVAVIGAGAAGLVSTKSCLDEGLEPTCFEKASHIAGLWHFTDEPRRDPHGPGAVYRGLYTNISKENMAFSDFPFPKTLPPYMTHSNLDDYYMAYADHFGLHKHIQLNTEVISIEKADDFDSSGQWYVTVRTESGNVSSKVFDAVMVCSGLYSSGHMPDYPGLHEFKGQVLHSCQVTKGSDFTDQTVLVVGAAYSAGDMACISSDHAKQVYISMRNGAWIIPRVFGHQMLDARLNQRWRRLIPGWLHAYLLQASLESLHDATAIGVRSARHPASTHLMLNNGISERIHYGTVRVKGSIERFEGSKVIFNDGSVVDVDAVIFATGYEARFPFFKKEIVSDRHSERKLYKGVLPQLEQHTLAFVGMVVPYSSGQNGINEMQARFTTRVFKDRSLLPSREKMAAEIDCDMEARYEQFGNHFPWAADPTQYKDDLAAAIGALPSLTKMALTDPTLFYHYYFGPAYPASYRLVGPGAKPDAREAFLQSGANQVHAITFQTVRGDAAKKMHQKQSVGFSHPLKFSLMMALIAMLLFCILM